MIKTFGRNKNSPTFDVVFFRFSWSKILSLQCSFPTNSWLRKLSILISKWDFEFKIGYCACQSKITLFIQLEYWLWYSCCFLNCFFYEFVQKKNQARPGFQNSSKNIFSTATLKFNWLQIMNLVYPNLVDTSQVTRIFNAGLLTLPYWLAFIFKNECELLCSYTSLTCNGECQKVHI